MKLLTGIAALLLGLVYLPAYAQQRELFEDYDTQIAGSGQVNALGPDLFGDSTDLYTGATQFLVTDVSVPGNSDLPVAMQRKLEAYDTGLNALLKWSRFEVPYLSGIFKSNGGWVAQALGNPSQFRCSANGGQPEPPEVSQSSGRPGTWESWEYWHGNHLYVPGAGSTMMLSVDPQDTNKPTDGATYRWVTKGRWYFSCLPATRNGVAGEGFLGVAPDGKKYYFDWVIKHRPIDAIRKPADGGSVTVLSRDEYRILATRIEDRFGNWVAFAYSGKDLTSITANDGRQLTLTYDAPNGNVITVSDGTRIWTYDYSSGVRVTLPDSSIWRATISGAHNRYDGGNCVYPGMKFAGESIVTIEHPSGAVGSFTFRPLRRGLSHIPHNVFATCQEHPRVIDNVALYSKSIAGPGLQTQIWSYTYGPANDCYDGGTVAVCNAGSPTTRYVEVAGPDRFSRYTFGNRFRDTDGLLFQIETGSSSSAILRSESLSWRTVPAVGWVLTIAGDGYLDSLFRTEATHTIAQDGVTYNRVVNSFDALNRPVSVTRSNASRSRTDITAYHDNTSKWVLGQISTVTNNDTGQVISQTDYDGVTALPLRNYNFGKLVWARTYNTDGTIDTVTDGNNKVIRLSSWHRGIPRNITYPDNTTQSAIVNDAGWITAVTDQNGYATGYGHDAMGRLASIVYPAGDTVAWNTETIAFQQISSAERGLPAGHWRQTRLRGSRQTFTYFDALWRAVMMVDVDAGNSSIQSQTIKRYDHDNRVVFESYPTKDVTDFQQSLPGIHTAYDTFGRAISSSRDSELGQLVSTTQYLSGNEVLVTNARGYQTRAGYLFYDQPSYEHPLWIQHAEGAYTDITRDVYGKPTAITRRNASSSELATRRYVYDGYQQLCKTIEPETGATVVEYDGVGNIAWSAAGLALPDISDCNRSAAYDSGRRVYRTYDNLNRLRALGFPGSIGFINWLYTADGLVAYTAHMSGILVGSSYPVVSQVFSYNKRRLLTRENVGVGNLPPGVGMGFAYSYDANGSLSGNTWYRDYPAIFSIDYAPNALGQPTRVGNFATGVQYHPNGAVKQFTYGNGVIHTLTQNARQLPQRISDLGGGNPLDLAYSYDQNANVMSILDQVRGAPKSISMTYDGLDRLSSAASPMFGGNGLSSFTYDALDNLKIKSLGGSYTHTHYYDVNNRLSSVQDQTGANIASLSYDVQGNLQNKNGQLFDFDRENRLRQVVGQEIYAYDAFGRRTYAKHSTQGDIQSHYSESGKLVYQDDYRRQLSLVHLYLGSSLIAIRELPLAGGAETVKYQHTDALGTPVAVTNASGNVTERSEYEPYGKLLNRSAAGEPGFTGHVQDASTALIYMQQRYYDPQIGRFLSVDPVTTTANGKNFNRYWYADNNPYRFTDPDGRASRADPIGWNDLTDWFEKESTATTCSPGCAKAWDGDPDSPLAPQENTQTNGARAVNAVLFISSAVPEAVIARAANALGKAGITVYRSVNSMTGHVQYVGITNSLSRRAAQHLAKSGIDIEKVMGGLTRSDAKAVEQVLIEIHGLAKNGGTLLNKINSIAKTNPMYAKAVQRGQEVLEAMGYQNL